MLLNVNRRQYCKTPLSILWCFSTLGSQKIKYYFGDERCVSPDHQDSNYGMVKRALFSNGIPKDCKVTRMKGEVANREAAVKNYEQMLPESIDVLLLSVGQDGHIASLFPLSNAQNAKNNISHFFCWPKTASERLTITPHVINSAKSTFLFT